MNQFDQQWRKLTALARQAGDSQDATPPYGFATRVAARACSTSMRPSWASFQHFAVRGLLVAVAFGVAAVAFEYGSFGTSVQTDAYVAADTVGELLDQS